MDSVGNTTYAFEIITIDTPDNVLYNLIATQNTDGQEMPPFIIKYEFENATKYDFATPSEDLKFQAKTSIYSYENFLQTETVQSRGTTQSRSTTTGPEPCVEINTTNGSGGGGGNSDGNYSGGKYTEQTSSIGGKGGDRIYIVPIIKSRSKSGGGGGGKTGHVICGELVMHAKFNSANRNFNTDAQAKVSTNTGNCPEGEVLLSINKLPAKIINNLIGKANCVYENLLESGVQNPHNLITKLFIEFGKGNIGNNDLTFKMATDLSNSAGGKTVLEKSGNFEILINSKMMNKLSSIEVAAILVHEIAHAFLGKPYNNSEASFKELYRRYINDKGLAYYSHDILKDKFIIRMATVLKNYDDKLFFDFEDYQLLASQGIFNLTTDQKNMLNAVKTKARNNDTKCKN